jgi:hypothetical protein
VIARDSRMSAASTEDFVKVSCQGRDDRSHFEDLLASGAPLRPGIQFGMLHNDDLHAQIAVHLSRL